MIAPTGMAVSDAARRAETIYAQARSQIDTRLWRAALGSAQPADVTTTTTTPQLALTTLVGLFAADGGDQPVDLSLAMRSAVLSVASHGPALAAADTVPAGASGLGLSSVSGLGSNARYSPDITSAADRTGIPAAALAAIIDAESARNRDGSWQVTSRNLRSSAAGIGQFLSGTWKSEAERVGTWLNTTARDNGWIGSDGQVLPAAHVALLDLRNNAEASINATADYASHSLDKLASAGVAIGKTADVIARIAYLGHNLGIGDAVRFLRGEISEGRARHLLDAQIGGSKAAQRIADAGGAVSAHRDWLLGFIAKHVDATRFL